MERCTFRTNSAAGYCANPSRKCGVARRTCRIRHASRCPKLASKSRWSDAKVRQIVDVRGRGRGWWAGFCGTPSAGSVTAVEVLPACLALTGALLFGE
jgi:hypothetical protein